VIEPVAAESLWTSAQFEMLPLESVFTSHIELSPPLNWFVEPAAMNPPSLVCWLEGVEVPVGILNVRTVDLVPLHVAGVRLST
jgi:hypothetical protein